jgi:hypothetical protein
MHVQRIFKTSMVIFVMNLRNGKFKYTQTPSSSLGTTNIILVRFKFYVVVKNFPSACAMDM